MYTYSNQNGGLGIKNILKRLSIPSNVCQDNKVNEYKCGEMCKKSKKKSDSPLGKKFIIKNNGSFSKSRICCHKDKKVTCNSFVENMILSKKYTSQNRTINKPRIRNNNINVLISLISKSPEPLPVQLVNNDINSLIQLISKSPDPIF